MLKGWVWLAAAGSLAASVAQAAECAPAKMVKVTARAVTPGLDPASPAAKARTTWRLTERYARVEEAADPPTARRMLMVVNEPDVWMVDTVSRRGQHLKDPGPDFEVRTPIFANPQFPELFAKLETGCELDFVRDYAPRSSGTVTVEGQALDLRQVSVGPARLEILLTPDAATVFSVGFYRDGRAMLLVRYLDYQLGLEPDMALFARPEGYEIAPPPGAKP